MTFDTTHLGQAGEDILEFYNKNKNFIINIHLSDYKSQWINRHFISQINSHLSVGKGKLPINSLLAALKKDNYKGLITMEINGGLAETCTSAKKIQECFT